MTVVVIGKQGTNDELLTVYFALNIYKVSKPIASPCAPIRTPSLAPHQLIKISVGLFQVSHFSGYKELMHELFTSY